MSRHGWREFHATNVSYNLNPRAAFWSFLGSGWFALRDGIIGYATGASPSSDSEYPWPQRANALMAFDDQ